MSQTTKTIETATERNLLHALAAMCRQYLTEKYDGVEMLYHHWMHAGEAAFEQLEMYGLITPRGEGGGWEWTEAGQELLELRDLS